MPRAVFRMNAIERRAFFGMSDSNAIDKSTAPTTITPVFATAVFVHSALRCSATSLNSRPGGGS
jgi:hypothetical protein